MGKQSKFPILYDDCKTVNVSKLVNWGYLEDGKQVSGTVIWSRFGEEQGRIGISVHNGSNCRYLDLDYQYNGSPKKYRVNLVSIASNLGKGCVWYFICPVTQKRCRKLYLCRGYFYHREAFSGCFYEKQTLSCNNRMQIRKYELYFGVDSAYQTLFSRHFKRKYNGKATKRFLKVQWAIKAGEGIDESELY